MALGTGKQVGITRYPRPTTEGASPSRSCSAALLPFSWPARVLIGDVVAVVVGVGVVLVDGPVTGRYGSHAHLVPWRSDSTSAWGQLSRGLWNRRALAQVRALDNHTCRQLFAIMAEYMGWP